MQLIAKVGGRQPVTRKTGKKLNQEVGNDISPSGKNAAISQIQAVTGRRSAERR